MNVEEIYDQEYAKNYDAKFNLEYLSSISIDYKVKLVKALLSHDKKWLDVACGTGYFLGKFPGQNRAGLDISPSMLALAKTANPDIDSFILGDFREANSELKNNWDFVTCMWGAYAYAESLAEAENIIKNMVSWIKSSGTFFLPMIEINELRPHNNINYIEPSYYDGIIKLTSYTWTWIEPKTNTIHKMQSLSLGYLLELLQPYFDTIDVKQFRPTGRYMQNERIIIAKGKRTEVTAHKAEITWHPMEGEKLYIPIENKIALTLFKPPFLALKRILNLFRK